MDKFDVLKANLVSSVGSGSTNAKSERHDGVRAKSTVSNTSSSLKRKNYSLNKGIGKSIQSIS